MKGPSCDLIQRCAGQLAPVEQQITEALKQAEVIHQDETGLYVAGKRHWMHVTCTPTLTHYHVDKSRGQAALEAIGILPYFTGISIHDGWGSYFLYDCQHAACIVHLLRDLVFLAEEQGAVWAADLKELLLDMKQATDQAREQGKLWLDPLEVVDWETRFLELLDEGDRLILMPWRLLEHEGDANKAPPAICLIGCANTSRQSWPSWRIFGWILIAIWPREIFAWSKCNKRSPAASGARLSPKPLAAFAAICPRCANKAYLCCRLCKPLFVVIPSFLHSSGPRQLQLNVLNVHDLLTTRVNDVV